MNDIVDLTDTLSSIIGHYADDTYGGLLDMDAWDVDDIYQLIDILEQVLRLRVDAALDGIDDEDFYALLDDPELT